MTTLMFIQLISLCTYLTCLKHFELSTITCILFADIPTSDSHILKPKYIFRIHKHACKS